MYGGDKVALLYSGWLLAYTHDSVPDTDSDVHLEQII